jgi:hypothetical protein
LSKSSVSPKTDCPEFCPQKVGVEILRVVGVAKNRLSRILSKNRLSRILSVQNFVRRILSRILQDFSAILAATQGKKPSVVQIRADSLSSDAIGRQVIAALPQMSAGPEDGALVVVDPTAHGCASCRCALADFTARSAVADC